MRALVVHAVAAGHAARGDLLSAVYELADDRDLPEAARGAFRR